MVSQAIGKVAKPRECFSCAVLVIALTCFSQAQTSATAGITGIVRDPKGTVVAGARVTARNIATGLVQARMSNRLGVYTIVSLVPGLYEVTCEGVGFERAVVPSLRLSVGQAARLDLSLPLGTARYSVTVSGAEPLLGSQTTNTQVLQQHDLNTLPVINRNFVQLTLLTPKVLPTSPSGARQYLGYRYRDNQFSFEGLHHQYNYETIDGANATVFLTNTVKSFYSLDSVQEFRVINSQYTAEQGHAMGGIINVITRSGTNSLHGEAYDYLVNDALNKPDFLATPGFHTFRRNQFGALAGGPIRKDKLFVFGTYEGQRQAKSPTYSTAFVQNLPAINVALQNLGLAQETTNVLPTISSNEVLLRTDYVASERNRVMLRYNLYRSSNLNDRIGTPGLSGDLVTPVGARHERLQDQGFAANVYSSLGATWTNDAGLGYARHAYTLTPRSDIPPLELDVLGVFSTGLTTVERAVTDRRFHVHDKVTWTHGKHELKFGAEYIHSDAAFQPGAVSSSIVPGLPALLAPQPTVLVTTLSTGTVPQGYILHDNQPGAFVQDQWRVKPHLTLTLGLRYDLEILGGMQSVVDSGRGNLQPRVGLAWSIGNDKPFIVRSGFGIYTADRYHPFMSVDAAFHGPGFPSFNQAFLDANPFARQYSPLPDTIASRVFLGPSALPALLGFTNTGGIPPSSPIFLATAQYPTLPNPYSEQWGLEVEHQLGRDFTIMVGYSGLHALKLPVQLNPNLRPATATLPSGKNDYQAVGPGRAAHLYDPNFTTVGIIFPAGSSSYNAGTISINKRFSGHYSLGANYVFSRNIDDWGVNAGGIQPEDTYNLARDRSVSNESATHRFTMWVSAEAPASMRFVHGFSSSLIVTAQSPRHYNVTAGSDLNHDGNVTSDRPDAIGRNTLRGDSFASVDMRVARRFRIGERFRIHASVDFFNLLNRVNITDVSGVYGRPTLALPPVPTFGRPLATGNAFQTQLGLKVEF